MTTLKIIFEQFSKFSSNLYTRYAGIDESEIINFEERLELSLPVDYRAFLRESNGMHFMGITVFGIHDQPAFISLEAVNKFEHSEVQNAMPKNLIAFSPDGGGNHYCFDLYSFDEKSCKIVFWQHDLNYSSLHPPEVVNNSFLEWCQEVIIDWTLEDYDYSGEKRT